MRQRLIVHIGMHKTGSSAIQRFLSRNRRVLRLFSIEYPETYGADGRRQPKHAALSDAISHEADHGAPHPVFGPSSAMIERLSARIERSRRRTGIISAEGLSGERDAYARALSPLRERFDVKVVIFIRRPDLWVESFYKQMVLSRQVRETRDFHAFVAADSTRAHLDFSRIVGWWREAFGESAVEILPFREGVDDLTGRFLRAAGLSYNLKVLPYARGSVNASPSPRAVEAMRVLNIRGEDAERSAVVALDSSIGESESGYFTRRERFEFLRTHRKAAQLAGDLSEYNFYEWDSFNSERNAVDQPRPWNAEAEAGRAALLLPLLRKDSR